ncbi:MAG: hypothetical protein ACRC1G_02320 [Bradyrhizobium sp.]|nr:hypothetical protein [Bradyrhizobium sp.]
MLRWRIGGRGEINGTFLSANLAQVQSGAIRIIGAISEGRF